MSYQIHIKTVDGDVKYDALSYGIKDLLLWVEVGKDDGGSETTYFSPSYWQSYVAKPHSEDPLGFID
ncbi:MAG: hypothetical protein WBA50_10775 [Mycobacterium sp.]